MAKILFVTGYAHRDMGTCFVLASLLRNKGHDCLIAPPSRAIRFHSRLWQPDAVYWMRINNLEKSITKFPHSLHYYCPGEGGEQYIFAEEKRLVESSGLYADVKRVFLWGEKSLDNMKRQSEELGDTSDIFASKEGIQDKIHLVGHPRMDIARFVGDVQKQSDKIHIGFIGSFSVINSASRQSLLSRVFNSPHGFTHGLFQLKLANTYQKLMDTLDEDKFTFSIRPYPAESRSEYLNLSKFKNGRLQVDKFFDFANWAAEQDIIVAPTSSTVPQIIMAKKPFLLVDFVDNEPERSVYRISLSKMFHEKMPENVPKSLEELVNKINNYEGITLSTQEMDELLQYTYGFSQIDTNETTKPSAIYLMAKHISDDLRSQVSKLRAPKMFVQLIDQLIKEDRGSYNDFRFRDLEKPLSQEFNKIITNIEKQKGI